jgi:hypothetical protein
VHAVQVRGDVDVHDVAVADHGVVRDAVADHLVERRAQRLRVPAVAERARVRAVGDQVLVTDPVQLVGGDSGCDMPPDLLEGAGGELPGGPHPLDRSGVLDLGLTGAGELAAHVFRPRDAGRDLTGRGKPAGMELGRHDLGV